MWIADYDVPQSEIYNPQLAGGVAQLAEHMVCNHGVRGSNPLTSIIGSALDSRSGLNGRASDAAL